VIPWCRTVAFGIMAGLYPLAMSDRADSTKTTATDPWSRFRGPLSARLKVWALRCGAFSAVFFVGAAGIVLQFVLGRQMEFHFRQTTFYWTDYRDLAPSLVVACVLASIGVVISYRERRASQRIRDRQGAEVLQAVRSNNPPRYYLYLRPFFLTNRMNVLNPQHGDWPMQVSYFGETKATDIETLLERAVHKSGVLVALGQPGEMIGAGRVLVAEEEWKEQFEVLARNAEGIFVIPSHRTGTAWEIGWLHENHLLGKCIFVMPPKIKPREKFDWKKRKLIRYTVDMKSLWNQAAGVLATGGLMLPPYSDAGLIFTCSDGLAVGMTAKIGDGTRLRTALTKVGASL
jgi:hypothetical protein